MKKLFHRLTRWIDEKRLISLTKKLKEYEDLYRQVVKFSAENKEDLLFVANLIAELKFKLRKIQQRLIKSIEENKNGD